MREAHRGAGHALAARQRLDAGAHLLGDAHRGEDAQAQHRRDVRTPRRRHLLDRSRPARRQELRQDEEPEEHLHDAAGCCGRSRRRRCRARTTHLFGVVRSVPTTEPIDERDHPRGERRGERPAQADQQVVQVRARPARLGLEEDAPVPVVFHARLPKTKRGTATSPVRRVIGLLVGRRIARVGRVRDHLLERRRSSAR